MVGSFNNWNILQFKNKNTSIKDFDKINKFVLGGISEIV